MRFAVAQTWILVLFLGAFLTELSLVGVSYLRQQVYSPDLLDLAQRFLAIYSIPLGVIISGIFAKSASGDRVAPKTAFWIAIALAAVWNLLILVRTLLFTFSAEDRVGSLLDYVNGVAAASSFLTVAALTYFFTTDPKREAP
jgi:hypothetical protein